MSAEQSLREGKVSQALEELQKRIRSNPGNSGDRVFLFQLLCVLGQWERAAAQLKMAGDLDASALITVQIYRRGIEAELLRAHVFSGRTTPLVIGAPQEWMALLLEALRLTGQEHYEQAAALRERALEDAPATSGTINGKPFAWLADGDSRFGPCLELVVDGKYCWTPVSNVRSLKLEAPSDLRDTVWAQCIVTWTNGGQVPALIPTRYPSSERSEQPEHQLARRTDWIEKPGDTFIGLGQRMLVTDEQDYPLLEVREVTFGATGGAA